MISKSWSRRNPLMVCVAWLCIFVFLYGHTDTLTRISKSFIQSDILEKTSMPPAERKDKVQIPDNYTGNPCDHTLDLPQEKNMKKIDSYEFPGIQNYITDLFPHTERQIANEDPVFVSAFSSNHYLEGLAMIYHFNKTFNRTRKLIVYDIGLANDEAEQTRLECRCEVRRFPFEKFPKHIGTLLGCPWKPIAIQLVAREYRFVVWMDASIRLRTSKFDELVELAKKHGVLASKASSSVAFHTSIETFRFLNEIPCLFMRRTPEIQANFVVLYQTSLIEKYFMIPWVSCALAKGCMVTNENVERAFNCTGARHYFHCHRFDQSVFSILMYRLFHKTISNHFLDKNKYHSVCRGCQIKEWTCPRMLCS